MTCVYNSSCHPKYSRYPGKWGGIVVSHDFKILCDSQAVAKNCGGTLCEMTSSLNSSFDLITSHVSSLKRSAADSVSIIREIKEI